MPLDPSREDRVPENSIQALLQLVVGPGLLNAWLVRAGSATPYRGGDARTLEEEFGEYGLPTWSFHLVGVTKVSAAAVLIAGLWAGRLRP